MASAFCNEKWKYALRLCACVVASFEVVSGSCSDDGDDRKGGDQGKECWYELWYFWFIVALVFMIIVVLVIFYCKQQVKRSVDRRGRRRTPVLTMPTGPPCYEEPGHHPPPYHIAMSTRPPDPSMPQQTQLPGCIADVQYADGNASFPSTLSIGAFSNPPPYSPPHTSHSNARPN